MTGIGNHSRETESNAQKCSVELVSHQMLLVDRLVDMDTCIGLTGNKLLYPVRREAISPASVGFTSPSPQKDREQNIQHIFPGCNMPPCSVLPVGLFQSASLEADQNIENRITSCDHRNTNAHKTEVAGHTMETPMN